MCLYQPSVCVDHHTQLIPLFEQSLNIKPISFDHDLSYPKSCVCSYLFFHTHTHTHTHILCWFGFGVGLGSALVWVWRWLGFCVGLGLGFSLVWVRRWFGFGFGVCANCHHATLGINFSAQTMLLYVMLLGFLAPSER